MLVFVLVLVLVPVLMLVLVLKLRLVPVLKLRLMLVLAYTSSICPDTICLSHSVDSSALSYTVFSRSISVELDSEGSIMSTCTEYEF